GGKTEIVVNSSAGISGHDFATGARTWYFDEPNRFPIPTPLAQDGVIYASRGYRSSPVLAIRAGGSGDVAATGVVWRMPSGAVHLVTHPARRPDLHGRRRRRADRLRREDRRSRLSGARRRRLHGVPGRGRRQGLPG